MVNQVITALIEIFNFKQNVSSTLEQLDKECQDELEETEKVSQHVHELLNEE